jgi:hypothetical protein
MEEQEIQGTATASIKKIKTSTIELFIPQSLLHLKTLTKYSLRKRDNFWVLSSLNVSHSQLEISDHEGKCVANLGKVRHGVSVKNKT